ncbi:gamma-butyrobetaine hydroxylase [Amanita muscaria]
MVRLADLKVSYTWLRDSCFCPQCVHPSTSQKLHRSSDMLHTLRSTVANQVRKDDGWQITWKDGHSSFYPRSFLERYAVSNRASLAKLHHHVPVQPWVKQSLQKSTLFLPYSSLSTSQGLVTAIEQVSKYGILFVTGVPNEKTSNEECETRVLADKFGEIRPTFYGLLWDVVNKRSSKNIAYTNLNLDVHMDLLFVLIPFLLPLTCLTSFLRYFQHPPRYQILHCLRNRVVGGTSVFVDALHAAETLRQQSPLEFITLATTQVPFHYINDGHHLYYTHPTIELDPTQMVTPLENRAIKHVNYAPPFQAPIQVTESPEQVDQFYTSIRKFEDLLDTEENRYQYTLREGDAVVFDNRRVLHARTAFEDTPGMLPGG